MKHVAYYCGPHDNWKLFKPGKSYVRKDGSTRPADVPRMDGLAFGYTVESEDPSPGAPRGVRHVVAVNEVLLDVPVQILDGGVHLGMHADGSPKWLGVAPTAIEEEPAQRLIRDIIERNRHKRKALSALLEARSASTAIAPSAAAAAALPPASATLLEKAANDSGFDLSRPSSGAWLAFASTHAPLELWLTIAPDDRPAAALSMASVVRVLEDEGAAAAVGLPPPAGSVGPLVADDLNALRGILRRAFAVARALPDQPLREFRSRTSDLPRSTEAERLVIQRVGQDIFREKLLDYWQGRCAVTGLAIPELLRASHIKPWSACEADAERLDVFNGLLLAPHLDAVFDQGFITVAFTGDIVVSDALASDARGILGIGASLRVAGVSTAHETYLRWHRARVFRG